MPRLSRKYNEYTKTYHVILRGIDKQDIFLDDQDRYKFLSCLVETKEKFNYEIYSYCLMDNHVHLLIYDINMCLSKIMQSIAIEEFVKFHNLDVDGINDICEYEMTTKLNDEEAKECMKYILKEEEIYEMKNYSKKDRDDILKLMSQIKGISLAQIARITGINKKVVERAVKKKNIS